MAFIRPVCTSCGATLPAREEGEHEFECNYCGTRFHWEGQIRRGKPPKPEKTVPPPPQPDPSVVVIEHTIRHEQTSQGPRKSGCFGCLFSLVLMLVIAGVAVTTFVSFYFGGEWKKVLEAVKGGQFEQLIETAVAPRRWFIWDTFSGSPIPVTVAGKVAVVGRVRQFPEDNLFIVALSLKEGDVLWQIGPLGTYSEGYQHVAAAVAGDRVAVSDSKANLTLYELDSGEKKHSLALSDKAERVCADPDGDGFWVGVVDQRNLFVSRDTTTSPQAEPPVGCAQRWEKAPHKNERPVDSVPAVDGFKPLRVWEEGKVWLAAGIKHPGSEIPRLIRFGKILQSPLWDRVVPDVDPNTVRSGSYKLDVLENGKYVAVYGTGTKPWRLCAWNAETGERLWDRPLRTLFAVDDVKDLVLNQDYIVVLRTSSLEVWGLGDGKLLATFGNETYELVEK